MQNKFGNTTSITQKITLTALLTFSFNVMAQAPAQTYMPQHPMHQKTMPMQGNMPFPSPMENQNGFSNMPFPNFPTPEEMAKLTPPEPMTIDKIKSRFAQRKTMLTESLERDRKSAEKYARDFAKYQKHQADMLAEIMAKAEQRRNDMLVGLENQEKDALVQFEEYQQQKSVKGPAASTDIPKKQ